MFALCSPYVPRIDLTGPIPSARRTFHQHDARPDTLRVADGVAMDGTSSPGRSRSSGSGRRSTGFRVAHSECGGRRMEIAEVFGDTVAGRERLSPVARNAVVGASVGWAADVHDLDLPTGALTARLAVFVPTSPTVSPTGAIVFGDHAGRGRDAHRGHPESPGHGRRVANRTTTRWRLRSASRRGPSIAGSGTPGDPPFRCPARPETSGRARSRKDEEKKEQAP